MGFKLSIRAKQNWLTKKVQSSPEERASGMQVGGGMGGRPTESCHRKSGTKGGKSAEDIAIFIDRGGSQGQQSEKGLPSSFGFKNITFTLVKKNKPIYCSLHFVTCL